MKFITTSQQLQDSKQLIADLKIFSLDSETRGLDPYTGDLLLLQIGNKEKQFIIDCRKVKLEPLKEILADESIIKIGANIGYDHKWLRTQGIYMENMIDILLNERILNAGKISFHTKGVFALEGVAKKYLNITLDKEIRESFYDHRGEFTEEQLEYAAKDVKIPEQIWELQKLQLLQEGLWSTFLLESECIPCFSDMEYNGIYLDKKQWYDLYEQNVLKMNKYKKLSEEIFRDVWDINLLDEVDLNIESNPQLLIAFNKLGYKVSSTKEEVIQLETPKEVHDPIVKYREYKTAVSRYGLEYINTINPVTNRIHTSFFQIGAESSRPSSINPNLLNIPREEKYRSCFKVQQEENKILTNDFSAQEARIVSELSKDQKWINAFKEGKNIHEIIGTKIFSLLLNREVKINKSNKEIDFFGTKIKTKALYDRTKNLNFASIYGAGVRGIMKQFLNEGIPCDVELTKQILELHRKDCPDLHAYMHKARKNSILKGYSCSIGGRKRYFIRPNLEDMEGKINEEKQKNLMKRLFSMERAGGNNEIQSTGVDYLKRSLIILRKKIKRLNKQNELLILLPPYDEIVCESRKNHQENQELIQESMVQAQEFYQELVPAEVEGIISDCWSK